MATACMKGCKQVEKAADSDKYMSKYGIRMTLTLSFGFFLLRGLNGLAGAAVCMREKGVSSPFRGW